MRASGAASPLSSTAPPAWTHPLPGPRVTAGWQRAAKAAARTPLEQRRQHGRQQPRRRAAPRAASACSVGDVRAGHRPMHPPMSGVALPWSLSTTAAATTSPYLSAGRGRCGANFEPGCQSFRDLAAKPAAQSRTQPYRSPSGAANDTASATPGCASSAESTCGSRTRGARARAASAPPQRVAAHWPAGGGSKAQAPPALRRASMGLAFSPPKSISPSIGRTPQSQPTRQAGRHASMGLIFSPPRLISSLRRPVSVRYPSPSRWPCGGAGGWLRTDKIKAERGPQDSG